MKKKNTMDFGIFNILLVGENSHAISIADNIHAKFIKDDGCQENKCEFNIVGDIEQDFESRSWFNEFIFDLTTTSQFNNIIVSKKFHEWMFNANEMEKLYMKKLLQAMNTIIIDISDNKNFTQFDEDIPQYKFNVDKDFLDDMLVWIDGQLGKVISKLPHIRLIRSLSGKNIPYLGDVFGCLSGKKYNGIIHTDKMRFDVPILFDEFCSIIKGRELDEIEKCIITRSSSALTMFFK